MNHQVSDRDMEYLEAFQACEIAADAFHHKEHVRLAYILLVQNNVDDANALLKAGLLNFLRHHGVSPSKFHETMTRAWLLAVQHFMRQSPPSSDSEEFINKNDILGNKDIIFTHYSRDLMMSDEARKKFLAPDLEPIPE